MDVSLKVDDLEARRIIQCIQDRIDIYREVLATLRFPDNGEGINTDIRFLESLIKKIRIQIK